MARHFPVLIDETTLQRPSDIALLAYHVVVGADKGRLQGSEKGFTPINPNKYRLVAFLSGEHPIRDQVDQIGAAARIAEIVLRKPIFNSAEILRWYQCADQNHGWAGRDLIKNLIKRYQGGRDNRWAKLRTLYDYLRQNTAGWCDNHPRLIEFLAVVQLGYILMYRQLNMKFRPLNKGELKAIRKKARGFAKKIYGQLNLDIRIDRVVSEIHKLPKINQWVKKGHVPLKILEPAAEQLGISRRGQLTKLMKQHGLISDVQPRQIRLKKMGPRKPSRCVLLTQEGQRRLSGN